MYSLGVPRKSKEQRPDHPMLEVWLARIGDEIVKKRLALGYPTQDAFAEEVKLSRQQVGIMERGSRSYTIGPLLEILSGVDNDPVASLLGMVKGLNSIDAETIELCRHLLLLTDHQRAVVSNLVHGFLEDVPGNGTSYKGSPRSL